MTDLRISRRRLDTGLLFARGAAVVSVIAGALVLIGWKLELPVLRSLLPGMPPMKPNAAVCFILSGVGLWLAGGVDWTAVRRYRLSRVVVCLCAAVVLLIASLTLLEYLSGWNLGLDELLFHEPGVINPGRIAPNAAVGFLLIHTALLLLVSGRSRTWVTSAGLLGAVTALLGLFAVLGWAGHVPIGYRWGGLTMMVAPAGFIFLLLGVGTVGCAWRSAGLQWLIWGRLLAGFILGLLVFSALSVVSYKSVQHLLGTAARVRETQAVLTHVRKLHAHISEMHSGVRGFALTGREDFLLPYHDGIRQQAEEMAALRQLTAQNPRQQARLDTLEALIAQRVKYGDEVMDVRRRAGMEAAAALVYTGRGLTIMNEIRAVMEDMEREESALLAQREGQATASAGRTFFILPVGTLIGISLFLGVLFFLNLEVTERRRAETSARESQERLNPNEGATFYFTLPRL